jgi:putative Holliday junction resolvase
MRILGIDFGDKNIGLAVSDLLGITAQNLGLYRRQGQAQDREYFRGLAEQYQIERVVIGLPLRMDGSEGSRVAKTKEFAAWLESALQLPVVLWDERLTTREAFRILREQNASARDKKAKKDQISAALILAAYLENAR